MAKRKVPIAKEVLCCILVFVILMSVVPSSAFAMRDNNSVSDKTIRLANTEVKAASVLEIKFTGTAVERCGVVAGADYWIVNVEELISGPPWTGKLTVYTINIFADSPIWGYADPDITVGDKVEVYGKCVSSWGGNQVTLNGREDYYIKRTDVTAKCGKITNWKTACTNVQLGGKFGAEMDFDNLMAGGYRFKGIVRVRSPIDEVYSDENQPRFVPSSPNNHGKFAGGNTLYVTIPEGASTGKYDVKLELWNTDTNTLCDETEWKGDIFTVEDGGAVSEIVFIGTAVEYYEGSIAPGDWSRWEVKVDEIISGPSELEEQTVFVSLLVLLIPGAEPYGYMDPNIEPGDIVEVYGWYHGVASVTVYPSVDYYIKKTDGTKCGKITSWESKCQGIYHPGDKVGAEMEFENLMGGGYNFKGVIIIRSPTGEEYSSSQVEWVPSAPNPHGKFAGGDALYVTIPEGASPGKYDMKLELWNDDTGKLCDATEWVDGLFTVEGNKCPVLSDGKVEPLEGGESTNFVFSVTYKDEDGDEPVGKYVRIIGFQGTNKVYDETKDMIRGSGDIKMGATYTYSTILPAADYKYYFYFSDGECAAYLPEEGYPGFEGPNVISLNIDVKIKTFDVEEGIKYPNYKVKAEAEIINLGKTSTFNIEYAIRDSEGSYYTVYDENRLIPTETSISLYDKLEWTIPSDIAGGECCGRLAVSDPDNPSIHYDLKWDFDAFSVRIPKKPDYIVTDIKFFDSPVIYKETTIEISLANIGGSEPEEGWKDLTVNVYDGHPSYDVNLIGTKVVPSAFTSLSFTLPWTPRLAGDQYIWAEVDATDTMSEDNEGNNIWEEIVIVETAYIKLEQTQNPYDQAIEVKPSISKGRNPLTVDMYIKNRKSIFYEVHIEDPDGTKVGCYNCPDDPSDCFNCRFIQPKTVFTREQLHIPFITPNYEVTFDHPRCGLMTIQVSRDTMLARYANTIDAIIAGALGCHINDIVVNKLFKLMGGVKGVIGKRFIEGDRVGAVSEIGKFIETRDNCALIADALTETGIKETVNVDELLAYGKALSLAGKLWIVSQILWDTYTAPIADSVFVWAKPTNEGYIGILSVENTNPENAPPIITLTSPKNGDLSATTVTISGTIVNMSDKPLSAYIIVDGLVVNQLILDELGVFNQSIEVSAEVHVITVRANNTELSIDNSAEISAAILAGIKPLAPFFSYTGTIPDEVFLEDEIKLLAKLVGDFKGYVNARINDTTVPLIYNSTSSLYENIIYAPSINGTYTLEVMAINSAEDIIAYNKYTTITVKNPVLTIAAASSNKLMYKLNEEVRISCLVKDGRGDNIPSATTYAVIKDPDGHLYQIPLAVESDGFFYGLFKNTSIAGAYSVGIYSNKVGYANTTALLSFDVFNYQPVVSIISPTNGEVYKSGDNITFKGSAFDSDGNILSFNWTSSIDEVLRLNSNPICVERCCNDSFNLSNLSVGKHIITLNVKSDDGLECNSRIALIIKKVENQPPFYPTLKPDKPESQPAGTAITLTASATDPDGDSLYYRFWIRGPATGNSWTIMQEWSTDNTWTRYTNSADIGNTDISVWIRDGHHEPTDSYDLEKVYFDYTITGSAQGLVAEWRFDEGSGNIVKDSSGNGNDGTVHGATFVEGVSEYALNFDGIDDYVNVKHNEIFNAREQISIEAWINWNPGASGIDLIVDKGGLVYWFIIDSGDAISMCFLDDIENTIYGTGVHFIPYQGKWVHAVGTYDGTDIRLYLNGELVNHYEHKGKITTDNHPLRIGANENSQDNFGGKIDEVRMYNRALSADEILERYNNLRPLNSVQEKITKNEVDDSDPTIVQISNGDILVAYTNWLNDAQIYLTRSSDNGLTWSTPVAITNQYHNIDPYITHTSDGKVWIVWTGSWVPGDFDNYYVTSDDNGQTWSPYTVVVAVLSQDEAIVIPEITQFVDGTIWITYHSNINGNREVYYTSSSDSGNTWSNPKQITDNSSQDWMPAIASITRGIGITWDSNRDGDRDIYLTKFIIT